MSFDENRKGDPQRLRVLHLIMSAGPTNGQYNEHCLPFAGTRDIGICSFFPATVTPPPGIRIFAGNGKSRGMWRALREARSRAWDVVHAHAPPAGLLLLLFNMLTGRSMENTVYTVQNSYGNYRRRRRLLLYPIFSRFARIIVCSDAVLQSLPPSLRRRARGKLTVVQNAVDTERIDRVLRAGRAELSPPGFTVVSIGRLIDIKNPHTLVRAFEAGGGTTGRLMFIGDGSLRPSLQQLATERRLAPRVTFTGLVERDDVYRLASKGNVFVSTSRGEGMPVAVLEAMACARPVVLSDIPPHREIAEGSNVVTLVPPDDVEGFAREIRRFRDMPPDRRAALGLRCREIVIERFGLARMHRAIESVYGSIPRSDSIRRAGGEESHVSDRLEVRGVTRAVRGRALLVAFLVALGAGAGFASTLNNEPSYRATTSVIVGHALRAPTLNDKDLEANVMLANTYSQLVRRQVVLQPVIDELSLTTTWPELRRRVRASVVPDTSLISISVDADTPEEAQAIAAQVAEQVVALSPTGASHHRLGFIDAQTSAIQAQIEQGQAELANLQRSLSTASPEARPAIQNRIDELERLIISWENTYSTMLSLLAEQRAANQLDILEPAAAEPDPIVRDPITYSALGGLAGLVAGLGLAYALHYRRHGPRRFDYDRYAWSEPVSAEPARSAPAPEPPRVVELDDSFFHRREPSSVTSPATAAESPAAPTPVSPQPSDQAGIGSSGVEPAPRPTPVDFGPTTAPQTVQPGSRPSEHRDQHAPPRPSFGNGSTPAPGSDRA